MTLLVRCGLWLSVMTVLLTACNQESAEQKSPPPNAAAPAPGGAAAPHPEAAAPPPEAAAAPTASPAAAPAAAPLFPPDQIEQMVAPIALYPDALIAQIFVAATYPIEVVSADRWVRDNATLEGDALFAAVDQQDWDASVKSLAYFPDVLGHMSQNLDWTKDLGDAFLAQRPDLFDAVQRLRAQAQAAGNLESTSEQKVVVEQEVIQIQPAKPEVVYVPTYNPNTVYGPSYAPPQPYYPQATSTESGIFTTSNVVSFGLGAVTGAVLANVIDWDDDDDDWGGGGYYGGGGNNKWSNEGNIYVDRSVNIDNSRVGNKANRPATWQHDSAHRRGVGYGDKGVGKRYPSAAPAIGKDAARGHAATGKGQTLGGARAGAGAGAKPKLPKQKQVAKAAPKARPAARPAAKPQKMSRDAFSGRSSGQHERQASARGAKSRGKSGAGMQRTSRGGGRSGGRSGGGRRR